jgi:hypothetical protein
MSSLFDITEGLIYRALSSAFDMLQREKRKSTETWRGESQEVAFTSKV